MTQIGNPLEFHTLTVTSIQFSNSGTKLLTAGRDRAWALFDISKIETGWKLIQGYPKAHSRIIWTCGFSHDDQYFATGSRDKTLKLWSLEQDQVCLIETIKFEHSVTSLAFFTRLVNGKYQCAAGLENGDIIILFFALGETVIVDKISFDQSITHSKTVKSLSWNPTPEGIFLASCSEDHSVKVYQID
jgi:elongator complex protein 2